MRDKPIVKNLIVFVIILVSFVLLYIILNKITNKKTGQYLEYLKNYEVNEYIPMYVSDEDMAKIYLNEYTYLMYSNKQRAYELLDEEYKLKKFGSVANYENYIDSLTYSFYKLDRYYVKNKGEYTIYGVYDTNGNLFIFKTKGVMQYSVYLDDYTVEI